ncbi:phosphopyruvate hydratase [Candidatus Berkelbacteria bacterium]|nr:phosphopyruvate hydratase [Candidatus Berkelbacteria bacterium]
MAKIVQIKASRILDSRGESTVEVELILDTGEKGVSSVPAGASRGASEAFVQTNIEKAVQNIETIIAPQLNGMEAKEQAEIDQRMLELDASPNKENLGGNSILAVSLSNARAAAAALKIPLYKHLARLFNPKASLLSLPTPCFNIINGGQHADNNLSFQEFMILMPAKTSFAAKLSSGIKIFQALKENLKTLGFNINVGDEGGFGSNLDTNEAALDVTLSAIEKAGFVPREEVTLGIDVAASSIPNLAVVTAPLPPLQYYEKLFQNYPLEFLEDPFNENDFENWQKITQTMGGQIRIFGDDLFTTNINRLKHGIEKKQANAIVIKPNQIGTLTETYEAVRLAKQNNFSIMVSHRSGETEDTFIADLAVAIGADFIKAGAPNRGERIAKYNQLLRIERELSGNFRD